MLDLRALSSGGATGGLGGTFVIAAGDEASVAGVPLKPNATLVCWGHSTTVADTIENCNCKSQDMVDPLNGETFYPGAAADIQLFQKHTFVPYKTGQRIFQIDQNTGAANSLAWTIDSYPEEGSECVKGSRFMPNQISLRQLLGGAVTAITWYSQAFAPATAIPNGKYALLGFTANILTDSCLVRFKHASFRGMMPGYPGIDQVTAAIARPTVAGLAQLLEDGYQFVYMGEALGQPCCPVFQVSNAGTGLIVQVLSITTDTPAIQLNLARISD
jgi:hypothetical protein